MRQLALEFARELQPNLSRKELQQIADALNGSPEAQNCSVSPSALPFYENIPEKRLPLSWNDNDQQYINIYVDVNKGDDSNPGTFNFPLKSIHTALIKSRSYGNEITRKIILREGRYYLLKTLIFTPDHNNLILTNYNNETVEISGAYPIETNWEKYNTTENNNYTIYYTDLSYINWNNLTSNRPLGLRINGQRGIRARYPNANPEIDGFGSNIQPSSWLPPICSYGPDSQIYIDYPIRNNSNNGWFQNFQIGIGGCCDIFVPPAGYFCSENPQGGGDQELTYHITSGLTYDNNILPHTPYKNVTNGMIFGWRENHWASWMFDIAEYSHNDDSGTIMFGRGGFQDGRGSSVGDTFFVENIFEELDSPNEWYFNTSTKLLYYIPNSTNFTNENYEITNLKVLIHYNGTISNPIKNIIIRGITFRDTAYTYMDDHALPSGGDWALQRTAAIILENTEKCTIQNNIFTRLDGNAILLNRYTYNNTIINNEFVWIGDNVIAAWGDVYGSITFPKLKYNPYGDNDIEHQNIYLETSFGYNGWETPSIQPNNNFIMHNYVHEIGIFEKQSSFYFQAQSFSNYIGFNIFFNGPRAGINFNDGFGGGSTIHKNLLFNTCRESGDHGPFNSWDRQVYFNSDNYYGQPPKSWDILSYNFMIGNYETQAVIDNDDGSSYYQSHNNFLVYGPDGLKSDFGGHDNHHFNNIYAYVNRSCFNMWGGVQLYGHYDHYFSNMCILAINQESYGIFPCPSDFNQWPTLGDNSIYTPNGKTGLCGYTEQQLQQMGLDVGTTVSTLPSDSFILDTAKAMLF